MKYFLLICLLSVLFPLSPVLAMELSPVLPVKNGDLNMLREVLNRGANPNYVDREGKSAIFYAVEKGKNIELAKLLIKHGAKLNQTDNSGKTPIIDADSLFIPLLVENGANVNVTYSVYGFSAMSGAASRGDIERMKLLHQHGAYTNNVRALDNAGSLGHFDALKYLVEKGSDINEVLPGEEDTPLINAAHQCDYQLIKILLSYGADPNLTINKLSPLFATYLSGSMHSSDFYYEELLKKGLGRDIGKNCFQAASLLISHGANVNTSYGYDEKYLPSPIFEWVLISMDRNKMEWVKMMISKGVDLGYLNDNGDNYLHRVVFLSRKKPERAALIRLLIINKVSFRHKNNENKTPVDDALSHEDIDSMREFLNWGANPNEFYSFRGLLYPYIVYAADVNNEKMVELLLKYKANKSARDSSGKDAMYYAKKNKNTKMIKILSK